MHCAVGQRLRESISSEQVWPPAGLRGVNVTDSYSYLSSPRPVFFPRPGNMGFTVERIALIEDSLRVHRVSLANMVLACFILVLYSSTSSAVQSEGLVASVNATFLSLSFCPPVWSLQSSMGPEASLQCSHKSLPLDLILNFEFSAHTFCLRSD